MVKSLKCKDVGGYFAFIPPSIIRGLEIAYRAVLRINRIKVNYPPKNHKKQMVRGWGLNAKTPFIPHFIRLTKPAGIGGDKGINTYGFIPYPPAGSRRAV